MLISSQWVRISSQWVRIRGQLNVYIMIDNSSLEHFIQKVLSVPSSHITSRIFYIKKFRKSSKKKNTDY